MENFDGCCGYRLLLCDQGTYEDRIEEITTEKKTVLTRINLVYSLLEKNNIIEKKNQALRKQKDSAKINDSLDNDYKESTTAYQ